MTLRLDGLVARGNISPASDVVMCHCLACAGLGGVHGKQGKGLENEMITGTIHGPKKIRDKRRVFHTGAVMIWVR